MDKYDALRDEVAYLEANCAQFSSLQEELGEENCAAYLPFVQDSESIPTLFVASEFSSSSFGIPYLEDSYIGLGGQTFQEGKFYANFETSLPSLRFGGKEFPYAGNFSCDLPFLDPLEERHPIERIALLVAPSSFLENKGVLQCAFPPGKRGASQSVSESELRRSENKKTIVTNVLPSFVMWILWVCCLCLVEARYCFSWGRSPIPPSAKNGGR